MSLLREVSSLLGGAGSCITWFRQVDVLEGLKPSFMYPLERAYRLFPSREVAGPDKRVEYAEMYRRVKTLAKRLASMGLGRGDFIAVVDVNSVRLMELAYASALVNSVFVPINFRLPSVIIEEILAEVRPKLLFYSALFEGLARLAPKETRPVRLEDYEALIDNGDSGFRGDADPDSNYVLLFTSGTTGRPKGGYVYSVEDGSRRVEYSQPALPIRDPRQAQQQ